jgi:N-methylhydantoinase A
MRGYRLTVDTGGTFSDFVYLNETTGEISIEKIPSTPDDPSRAILQGIEHLLARGVQSNEITYFCHGTTVGTNALLEGKGVKTGLLITDGFRAIYEVGEQARPHGGAIFDVMYNKPALLVPESATVEVKERISFEGEVLTALDEQALRHDLSILSQQGIESVAVCLLFSFLVPAHEQRVREIIHEEMPNCSVSLSSDVIPQIREYYRLSTSVINAYLQPILAKYINRLDGRLSSVNVATKQTYIMQSNGGMSTFGATAKKAVATVLSGPAGGVTASIRISQAIGAENVITFDMGGTSCDVSLIKEAKPLISNRGKIAGRDISIPMMDINTVSAGGGTIARVDHFGILEVGPESAGAVPGPACYARGGTLPTITDCNLVLGYLSPDNFLGGGMSLDSRKAQSAIAEHVADPLGIEVHEGAEGIIRIINVKMEEAIKAISTMRGHDLREFMLLAFGGAGPLHAGQIAQNLGMAGVIVPRYPGVFSAMGLVMSDVKHDYIKSRISLLSAIDAETLAGIFDELEDQAVKGLMDEGFHQQQIRISRALDLRYAGQGYEITVDCDLEMDQDVLSKLRHRFDEQHKQLFGHMAPHEPAEIVSYRVQGIGLLPGVELPRFTKQNRSLSDALRETRKAYFEGSWVDCPVYDRESLDVGLSFSGPAIVEQFDSTTVICPRQVASVDPFKNLIIKTEPL